MEQRSRLWQVIEIAGPVSGMLATALAAFLVVPFLRKAAAETDAVLPGIVQAYLDHGAWIAIGALALGTVSLVIIRMSPRRWVSMTCSVVVTLMLLAPVAMFIWGFWAFYAAMLESAGEL